MKRLFLVAGLVSSLAFADRPYHGSDNDDDALWDCDEITHAEDFEPPQGDLTECVNSDDLDKGDRPDDIALTVTTLREYNRDMPSDEDSEQEDK